MMHIRYASPVSEEVDFEPQKLTLKWICWSFRFQNILHSLSLSLLFFYPPLFCSVFFAELGWESPRSPSSYGGSQIAGLFLKKMAYNDTGYPNISMKTASGKDNNNHLHFSDTSLKCFSCLVNPSCLIWSITSVNHTQAPYAAEASYLNSHFTSSAFCFDLFSCQRWSCSSIL